MKEYALGIDIGGTNIVCGLVDRKGNILVEGSCSTADFPKVENMMDEVFEKFNEMKSKLKKGDKVVGIGIGAPNGNYYNGCIEFAPNLKWKGKIHLADMFKEKFKIPVFLTNDANAAALGEMIYGGAKNMKDFIVITIGTGLGSGIVCNGQVVHGHDGFAGELGHTIVYPQGRLCGCGRNGCLETYVSSSGLGKTIGEMLNFSRHRSKLRDIPTEEITSYTVYEAARQKDKIALEAFEFTGRILGMKLADAVAITSPEAIFLFGGVCKAGDYIIQPTKKSMEENLLPIFRNKVKILKSELLDKNAAVLGSAAMVWAELEK
jgi:glucokinase